MATSPRVRIIRTLAVASGLAGLTACGSTVPLSRTNALAGGTGSGLSANSASGAQGGDIQATGASAGGPAGSAASASTPGGGGSASGSAASTGLVGGGPAGSVVSGPSGSAGSAQAGAVIPADAPIRVGIPYLNSSQTNAVTGSIGSGLSSNDPSQLYTAYINDLNAHGGIAGHKVVPVYFSISPYGNLNQIAQSACDNFTQDNKVSFVISPPLEQFYSCLNRRGVAVMSDGPQETAESQLAGQHLAVLPEAVGLDRFSRIEAVQLKQMGFFGHALTDKLGVLYFDNDPDSVAGFNALKPALATQHVSIAASQSISMASGESDLGAMEAQVSSAELKFKAEGVNEVVCVESNAWICGFFGVYAAGQDYYPRYAFSSEQPLTNIQANVPAKELTGSVFLGWYPAQDLQNPQQMPASLQSCFAFFEKQGISITTGNARSQAEGVCADVNYFAAALEAASSISPAGLVQGAEKLGSSYSPIGDFGISVTPDHRDGAVVMRRGAFVPSCDCFEYTSGNINVG